MRKPLSWRSEMTVTSSNSKDYRNSGKYQIWLKKPNYFRMEVPEQKSDEIRGILVGDGMNLWVYWPQGHARGGHRWMMMKKPTSRLAPTCS